MFERDPFCRRGDERLRGGTELPLNFEDVRMHVVGDVAIVTFHLRGTGLSRRTLVLVRGEREWHIVHLHASVAATTG
jgi:ketosteroid isomerase-like protein